MRLNRKRYTGAETTDYNVPQFTSEGIDMPSSSTKPGNTHILIFSYEKDLPWLELCLRGLAKNAKGFSGITVAHPSSEQHIFNPVLSRFGVSGYDYPEVKGKGMVQHMAKMAKADTFLPKGTEFVFHMDSDCIMHAPSGPEDYIIEGKPHYLYRSYQSLADVPKSDPEYPLIAGCYNWKGPTEKQLGMKVDAAYTMCRHPTVFPVGFYEPYRNHIEKVHGMDFEKYMVSGHNEWPQDRMDLTAMGAFAFLKMNSLFHWLDTKKQAYPKDRLEAFWSHGGITPEIRAYIESLLK